MTNTKKSERKTMPKGKTIRAKNKNILSIDYKI